jgi:acetyl-CoA decarbonylase/synthase complex subunit alpha
MDFESKALHAGMLDILGMEISDIIQIMAYDMPRGDEDAPLIECGMGTLQEQGHLDHLRPQPGGLW